MIPKIIHYCWFGGGKIPDALKQCMKSWTILENAGYEIRLWSEANCTFDENDFVRQCYQEKKWGYIGDYYRAKALYDEGGVYLDTDVEINKPFDELLDNKAFIGFSCDCAMCTAVIGAEKGSSFFKGIMDMYDSGQYYTESRYLGKSSGEDDYAMGKWAPSNEYWTWYLIVSHPDFKLNNKKQVFEDITVYPKSCFELGSVFGEYYCRHINFNSWREQQVDNSILKRLKRKLEANQKCWTIIRTIRSVQGQKKTSFYKYMEN